MTGYESKKKAAQDKLDNDDLTIAYQSGYYDGKKAAQEPNWAWATKEDFYRELDRMVERMRKEMEIKTVTMRCKDFDVALPIIDTDFGHVLVGQVSTPPQRPWVGLTDEERKPLIQQAMMYYGYNKEYWLQTSGAGFCLLVQAIEAKLKEKNT